MLTEHQGESVAAIGGVVLALVLFFIFFAHDAWLLRAKLANEWLREARSAEASLARLAAELEHPVSADRMQVLRTLIKHDNDQSQLARKHARGYLDQIPERLRLWYLVRAKTRG